MRACLQVAYYGPIAAHTTLKSAEIAKWLPIVADRSQPSFTNGVSRKRPLLRDVVSLTFVSWNQIGEWLKCLDALRRVA